MLLFERVEFEGQKISVVHSGDTIVDPGAWGSSMLARTWIDSVRRLHLLYGHGRLWWLLITSGFRTYRFLPVFWKTFFPRFGQVMPPDQQAMLNMLAHRRYGDAFNSETGVVQLAHPQRLRGELIEVPEGKRRDPHVAFFLETNPGCVLGDELVCLAELGEENLTRAGWRMVHAGEARRKTEQ